jgi:hypothetical protein
VCIEVFITITIPVDISQAFMLMKPVKENTESSSVRLMSCCVFPVDLGCKVMYL